MQDKILISSPDAKLTKNISDYLRNENIQSDSVLTGRECQLKIYQNDYKAVVLDLMTKDHSGLEVLKYIRLNKPFMTIILTVPDKKKLSDLEINEDDLKKSGVACVLLEPFHNDKIVQAINPSIRLQSWKTLRPSVGPVENVTMSVNDEEFTKIKVSEIHNGSPAIFDLYERKAKNKFLKIVSKGDLCENSEIMTYPEVAKEGLLYFKTKDRGSYINFINESLSRSIGSGKQSTEKKLQSIKSVSELYITEIYTSGISPEIVEEGKKLCDNMYQLVKNEKGLVGQMNIFEEGNPNLYSSQFLVSFFSTVIARNLDWSSVRTVETVALAGLLQDIGMLKVHPNIRAKKPADMNAAERSLYEQHPALGEEMLRKFPSIPQAIRQIVYQHHELVNKSGFPNQMSGTNIYPLAKIVSLAVSYSEFLINSKLSPLKGLRDFMMNKEEISKHDPDMLRALVKGFIKGKAA